MGIQSVRKSAPRAAAHPWTGDEGMETLLLDFIIGIERRRRDIEFVIGFAHLQPVPFREQLTQDASAGTPT